MSVQLAESASVDVLIAEDDATMRESLCRLLEGEGYHCAQAGDGAAAVEMARRMSPRCAILDLGMPGLDGFSVARRLRSDPAMGDLHIHCLTGRSDAASREEARAAGIETYLIKPFDPVRILQLIREQVRSAEVVCGSGLGFTDAREMLDRLENTGWRDLRVVYETGKGFTVSGVPKPLH